MNINSADSYSEKILSTDTYLSSVGEPIRIKNRKERIFSTNKRTFSPLAAYQGGIKEGLMDGKGSFLFHNGFSRQGLFHQGKFLEGFCFFENEDSFYASEIKDKIPLGEGFFIFKQRFNTIIQARKSSFESGLNVSPWDNGVFYIGNTSIQQEQKMNSCFIDQESPLIKPKLNQIHRLFNRLVLERVEEEIIYENVVYRGETKNGLPHGAGVMRDTKGFYEKGFFRDGVFCKGCVLRVWEEGSIYEGECREFNKEKELDEVLDILADSPEENFNSIPHGKGVLRYSNGDYVIGKFVDGIFQEGQVQITQEDGTCYKGSVKKRRPEGLGLFKTTEEFFKKGVFSKGKFINRAVSFRINR